MLMAFMLVLNIGIAIMAVVIYRDVRRLRLTHARGLGYLVGRLGGDTVRLDDLPETNDA